MQIDVEWYDEAKTIIVQHYPEKWTWDDFKRLQDIIPPMMREVSHTVHVVGDYSRYQHIPGGNPIVHARNLLNSYPDNFGILIIVTRTGMIETFVKVFMNLFGSSFSNKIHIVHSFDDIPNLIAKYERSN